jgi:hypothetical protein
MTHAYFATALVGAHRVGVTIRARNIATAFEVAEQYLQDRHPKSDVIVQAVQRITRQPIAALTPSKIIETNNQHYD